MPYSLGKLLALLALPSSLIALSLLAGLWMIRRGSTRRIAPAMAWGGLLALVVGGFTPLGYMLIVPLEERFAAVPRPGPADRVDGIILLGGFEEGWITHGRGGLALNSAAERVTEGLRLALRHPDAKVVFAGGAAGFLSREEAAAGPVAEFLADAGVARDRIVIEDKSRTTYENALFTRDLVEPQAGQRWYLVTSAFHMPRAIGLFRKAGFDVVAYPVDFRTRGAGDATRFFERIPLGLFLVDLAVKEWQGLVAYRALGRIDEVFPAP